MGKSSGGFGHRNVLSRRLLPFPAPQRLPCVAKFYTSASGQKGTKENDSLFNGLDFASVLARGLRKILR